MHCGNSSGCYTELLFLLSELVSWLSTYMHICMHTFAKMLHLCDRYMHFKCIKFSYTSLLNTTAFFMPHKHILNSIKNSAVWGT